MSIFAHIFVGKEYKDLVMGIGRTTLRIGGSTAIANINYLVADIKDETVQLSRLVVKNSAPQPELIGQDRYTELVWSDYSDTKLAEFGKQWRDVYNELITATMGATQLYVMLHFPLYTDAIVGSVQNLYGAITSVNMPMQIDFVGYCEDLAHIVEPGLKEVSHAAKQAVKFAEFRKNKKLLKSQHLIVLQNSNRYGITLSLNAHSLTEVISHFAISCSNHYTELFPSVVVYKDVVAFGLASIEIDKFMLVDYLLQRTVLNAMDMSCVNQKDVSSSKASEIATNLLKGKLNILSEFFKITEEKDFSEVQKGFCEEAVGVYNQCLERLNRTKSIPDKVAILATLLSKNECELFSQAVYNQDGLRIYDLFSESLDFFIENDYGGYLKVGDKAPTNPIPELKKLDALVIDLEAQRRAMAEQLEILGQQIDKSHNVEECYLEDGVFHFKGHHFRLMPDLEEDPLEDIYQPSPNLILRDSIDLRGGFRPIQSQGSQGSCLAHALTAIFEYASKLSTNEEIDLSEAFLYYNAREMDSTGDVSTNTDIGSRVTPAVQSLMKYGIAKEEFCRYNEDDWTTKPSAEAYADAAKRRLIKAMSVERNTAAIKSALNEGYPVAISLALCKSFNSASNDGYVPMPSQEEIEERFAPLPDEEQKDKHSSHAMVVVGYSEKLRRFIVRNSWDVDWGENGYCYVPYEYIDHERLCQSATIFTEIESLPTLKMENIPFLAVDDQDLNIRYYIAQASLAKIESDLAQSRQQRNELFIACQTLIAQFSSQPLTRDGYLKSSTEALQSRIDDARNRRKEIEEMQELKKKELKKFYLKTTIISSVVVLLCWLLIWGINSLVELSGGLYHCNYLKMLYVIVPGLICVIYITTKRWKAWREESHELANDDAQLDEAIRRDEKIKQGLKYKTYSTYHLMQEISRVHNLLENRYLNLLKMLNNLRAWYKETDLMSMADMSNNGIPIISLLDKELLDQFFNENIKGNNEFEIDFCETIKSDALISTEDLADLRHSLVDKATIFLRNYSKINSFSMSRHIAGPACEWLVPVDRKMANECDSQSDLFIHFSPSADPDIQVMKHIISHNVAEHTTSLAKVFPTFPKFHSSDDGDRLLYLTVAPLSYSDCEILKN